MRYIINNHEIEFDRKAMTAAHQAFPLEFAEWNLALKLKGKALLPGVQITEIGAACMTESDRGAKPIFGSERAAETTPSAPVPPAPALRVFVHIDGTLAVIAGEKGCYYVGQGAGVCTASTFAMMPYHRPATEAEAAKAFRDAWAEESGRKWLQRRGWKPKREWTTWGAESTLYLRGNGVVRWFHCDGMTGVRESAPDANYYTRFETNPVTEEYALQWLRDNNHAKMADEMEGK